MPGMAVRRMLGGLPASCQAGDAGRGLASDGCSMRLGRDEQPRPVILARTVLPWSRCRSPAAQNRGMPGNALGRKLMYPAHLLASKMS